MGSRRGTVEERERRKEIVEAEGKRRKQSQIVVVRKIKQNLKNSSKFSCT